MSAATITSKGQITIPKEIRALLGLHSGDRINFIVDESGEVRFVPVTRDVRALKGMIRTPKKPVELEEMAATIKKRASQL